MIEGGWCEFKFICHLFCFTFCLSYLFNTYFPQIPKTNLRLSLDIDRKILYDHWHLTYGSKLLVRIPLFSSKQICHDYWYLCSWILRSVQYCTSLPFAYERNKVLILLRELISDRFSEWSLYSCIRYWNDTWSSRWSLSRPFLWISNDHGHPSLCSNLCFLLANELRGI